MLVWVTSTSLSPMYTIPEYQHVSLYCTVLHITRGAVVLLAGVDTHPGPEPGPLRGVQHMGHAQQAQVLCVPGSGPEVKMFLLDLALLSQELYESHS